MGSRFLLTVFRQIQTQASIAVTAIANAIVLMNMIEQGGGILVAVSAAGLSAREKQQNQRQAENASARNPFLK